MAAITRRQGREWALQMIVQADLNPGIALDKMIGDFWQQQWTCRQEDAGLREDDMSAAEQSQTPGERLAPNAIRAFTENLVRGTLSYRKQIDEAIEAYSKNWSLYRLGAIERNVLRMAFYEMQYCPDVPAAVVINEGVDLAKYFSNTDAGRFVNGILDRLRKDKGR